MSDTLNTKNGFGFALKWNNQDILMRSEEVSSISSAIFVVF